MKGRNSVLPSPLPLFRWLAPQLFLKLLSTGSCLLNCFVVVLLVTQTSCTWHRTWHRTPVRLTRPVKHCHNNLLSNLSALTCFSLVTWRENLLVRSNEDVLFWSAVPLAITILISAKTSNSSMISPCTCYVFAHCFLSLMSFGRRENFNLLFFVCFCFVFVSRLPHAMRRCLPTFFLKKK